MSKQGFKALSGYKFMWVMVLFDLPTKTIEERRHYTRFRDFLLDQGFEMAQYSVYVKHTNGKEAVQAIIRRVGVTVPPEGKVDILQFTDKQYENIVCFRGKMRAESPKNPTQLVIL